MKCLVHLQVASRSLMAFTLAAGIAITPAPARAADVLFYGRPGPIAEKKADYEVSGAAVLLCLPSSALSLTWIVSRAHRPIHVQSCSRVPALGEPG